MTLRTVPVEPTDEMVDAGLRSTAAFLDIKGSQLTVNREKMRRRYKAMLEASPAGDEVSQLRAVLLDWRKTPGNQRTAQWWHAWLDSLDAALNYGQPNKDAETGAAGMEVGVSERMPVRDVSVERPLPGREHPALDRSAQ